MQLNWRVTRNARHAVEVSVVTGKLGQAVRLHQRHDQRVVDEQAGLLADRLPEDTVWSEVVDKGVGIHKDDIPKLEVGKGHASSPRSNSGVSARRRRSSGSPFQPNMPAVSWTQVACAATVTCTFSCSLKGNGSAGFRTPFS